MQTSLPTLYKLTKTGKVQQWAIVVSGSQFQTHEGLVGGAITASAPTQCVGKNVGRANETTPEQQALKEAQAKWQKKVDAGYGESFATASGAKYIEPMLARVYEEEYPNDELPFPVFVQPKLDGVRCIATKDGLFSRKGKPFTSCDHIREALQPLFDLDSELVFDGELYNHDYHDDFNTIVGCVKSQNLSDQERAEVERIIQYHVYDIPSSKESFLVRYCQLSNRLAMLTDHSVIRDCSTQQINGLDQLDQSYNEFIASGYEGQMIRLDGPYQFGTRSKLLLKMKAYVDAEFEITDITEGKGKRAGMMGRMHFKHDGTVSEGGCRGNDAFYRELWENRSKYIGQMATVRFQNYTPKGKLRCARMIALRDYE